MKFSPDSIAAGTRGRLIQGGTDGKVCTDTRAIEAGDWFLALKGERFDAHDFLDAAIQAGACGVVAERVPEGWSAGLVEVDDGLEALQNLGRHVRRGFNGPVVGITGSAGKTTTRALVGLVLEPLGTVHQTKGNFNNHIGLPLTLLAAPEDADALVLEMGMNHAGEIDLLQDIGAPNVRIITNVGAAHLEGLGTIEAVAAAKGEMFDGARPEDTICLNIDDPFVSVHPLPHGVRVITYGAREDAQVRMLSAEVDPATLHTASPLRSTGRPRQVWCPVQGSTWPTTPWAPSVSASLSDCHYREWWSESAPTLRSACAYAWNLDPSAHRSLTMRTTQTP